MSSQLSVLLVLIPVVAAIVIATAGLGGRRGGWPVAVAALGITAGVAGLLGLTVARRGRHSYALGGIDPPFGIEFVVDELAVTFCLVTALVSLGAVAYLRHESRPNHFYAMFLFLIAGLFGLALTGDLFTMFVFFEITGLGAYALVAKGKGGAATYAAFKYLLVGTLGASFYLLGVAYLYIVTGSLNMADVATRLGAAGYRSAGVLAAVAFVVVGIAAKVPLVPVHSWLPDAHSKAPPSVSAVVSALVSAAAAYALIRVLFTVFTTDFLTAVPLAPTAVALLASAGVVVGTVFAVRQRSVKRMLAYSTISQFGLVVAGIGVANQTSLTGSVVHLSGHAVMKAGLFLAAGVVATQFDAETVEEYAGIGTRAPTLGAAFVVLALAMVGIPPGIGFFGKWYIALGAVQSGLWPVALAVFASTLLTLGYFMRLLERIYFGPPTVADGHGAETAESARMPPDGVTDPWKLTVVVVAAAAAVAFGLLSNHLVDFLRPTLEVLLS